MLGSLDTLERYNLVDDAWNEVVAGRLAAADFLAFVEGFGGERELAVWQAIVLGLRGLGRLLDDDAYPAFQARVRALLAPVVADLGDPVDGEDDLRGKLRGLLVGALAIQGDDAATQASAPPSCTSAARPTRAASTPSSSPRPRRSSPPAGDEAVYERLLDGYRTAATPQDQLRHLYALAEFDAEALVLRTCELAMSGEVKTQNAPFLLRIVHRQPPPRGGGVDVRPPALGRGQRGVPEQHDRAHGRLGDACSPTSASPPTCRRSSPSTRSSRPPRRSTRSSSASASTPPCGPASSERFAAAL